MSFWKKKHTQENGKLGNGHYKQYFTELFGVDVHFYSHKKVLDVGCGPRGSLEWLSNSSGQLVCVDPLALNYSALGAWSHNMVYVSAGVESMPIASNSFDIVSSLNNFDHIENRDKGLAEILRVIRPGGLFMIAVEIHPRPTLCEPLFLGWDFWRRVAAAGFHPHRSRHWLNPQLKSHTSAFYPLHTKETTPGTLQRMLRDGSLEQMSGWFVGIFNKSRSDT